MPTGHPAPLPSPTPATPPSPPTRPTSALVRRAEEEPGWTSSEVTVDRPKVSRRHRSVALPRCDRLHQNRLGVWVGKPSALLSNKRNLQHVGDAGNDAIRSKTDVKFLKSQLSSVVFFSLHSNVLSTITAKKQTKGNTSIAI